MLTIIIIMPGCLQVLVAPRALDVVYCVRCMYRCMYVHTYICINICMYIDRKGWKSQVQGICQRCLLCPLSYPVTFTCRLTFMVACFARPGWTIGVKPKPSHVYIYIYIYIYILCIYIYILYCVCIYIYIYIYYTNTDNPKPKPKHIWMSLPREKYIHKSYCSFCNNSYCK